MEGLIVLARLIGKYPKMALTVMVFATLCITHGTYIYI